MLSQEVEKLPDSPGVYLFKDKNGEILYIGKATSLKSRVKSYFSPDLIATRGPLLVDMVSLADHVDFITTDSVLEALLLEVNLIKQHQPKYNTKEKDDKSHNFVVITKEKFPRVLIVRGKDLIKEAGAQEKFFVSWGPVRSDEWGSSRKFLLPDASCKYIFGPFPNSSQLKEAMKIIRKIFPFRDKCEPNVGKPCFNRQIGLCPGVCTGEISEKDYAKIIKNIKLFFEGKKKQIVKNLEREMNSCAKKLEFEKASDVKKTIFAINHIQDVAFLKKEPKFDKDSFRIEAFDVAHISGKNVVGAMTVIENGEVQKSQYRKFKIKINPGVDDTGALREILIRRFNHPEWNFPNIVVADGGVAQINAAESVIKNLNLDIPVVSVVKDERHKPREVVGEKTLVEKYGRQIILANSEAHRFVLAYHRSKRDGIIKS